ncbi:hypothetical protein ACN47E_007227 [Coniothyrium glycines]
MALLTQHLLDSDNMTWICKTIFVAILTYWITWVFYARTIHPLAKIPGPFLATISGVWTMYHAYAGDLEIQHRALHQRYGLLIRVAPDEIVCSDPKEIPRIYPFTNPLQKTPWYDAWRPNLPGRRDMFMNRDEKDHAAYRRTIGHVYSLSSVLKNEAKLEETVLLFIERLDEFAQTHVSFDFGIWLEMFAYDNIGVIFFGKQFGFLKDSVDYKGYIRAVHNAMPFLNLLAASPRYVRPLLMGIAIAIPALLKSVMAVGDVAKTAQRETKHAQARSEADTAKRFDMTSQMLGIVRDKGEKDIFGVNEIVSEIWIAVLAGADSTSIAIRTIFYYLMKNPSKLTKLRNEIDAAFDGGAVTSPVQHNQAVKLPYLVAVIRESFRIFSPHQISQPRISPRQGLVLAGKFIPGGYYVGCNAAVLHHHKDTFGEDTSTFRPERWIENTEEQIKLMQKSMLHFGAGTHSCIGQHIAMAETYKVVPEIIRRFDFKLTHDGEWKTQNAGFNVQSGVTCYSEKRQS